MPARRSVLLTIPILKRIAEGDRPQPHCRFSTEAAGLPGTKGLMLSFDDFQIGMEQFGQRIPAADEESPSPVSHRRCLTSVEGYSPWTTACSSRRGSSRNRKRMKPPSSKAAPDIASNDNRLWSSPRPSRFRLRQSGITLSRSGDRWFESISLQQTVRLSPAATFERQEPRLCPQVCEGFIKAGSVGFIPVEWKFADDKARPMGIDFKRQSLLEFSIVPVPANANALIEARSYLGHREPTMRELGQQIGRVIVAARLRNALPPRRTTYAERVAIAAALRRGE
jgi:hypothetical protein